ncbi:hypothetical protein B0T26DRAFT_705342 [Lasiosphaeria miniovina]|uniref:Uncharacterized protein n=1 Tax=Lasiosphaeria miniovina TaxID=1954250 RepID=A0AA40AW28_9PEZI|nr:uncharacterized protein B0T26DRAFT_705342 [Lasiosphaeria miniovina]KAK0723092.1 hypothetical protein B0T26DRAFT_705342 [Lasiosphaeria miniovina]
MFHTYHTCLGGEKRSATLLHSMKLVVFVCRAVYRLRKAKQSKAPRPLCVYIRMYGPRLSGSTRPISPYPPTTHAPRE